MIINHKLYNDYSSFIIGLFGERVQKISVNTGMSCPNRDGNKGTGGCTYCLNDSFSPFYCLPRKSIKQQVEEGIAFFSKKYQAMKYLVYFQTYTNTYNSAYELKKIFSQAFINDKIAGIVVATRPDCVDDEILDLLKTISHRYYTAIEFGVESTLDNTLARVNRHHTFQQAVDAIKLTAKFGLPCGIHLIFGLPGETVSDMIGHIEKVSGLPVNTLKIHQLQILKGTAIEQEYYQKPNDFVSFTIDSYIDLCIEAIEKLNPEIVVERFISETPVNLIVHPKWGKIKNFEFVNKLQNELKKRNAYQGKFYKKKS